MDNMASIEGETARSWPNRRVFAIETVGVSRKTCRVSAPLLPDFDKTLVNHLPESHVRLPPWRFFSHIPRLLSFAAALKAVFGDAIRKAGGRRDRGGASGCRRGRGAKHQKAKNLAVERPQREETIRQTRPFERGE